MKLKLQYFGHLTQRANSLEKTLILGKIEGKRRWVRQRMRWLYSITDWRDMSLSKLQDMVMDTEAWHAAIHGVTKTRTVFSDWTKASRWWAWGSGGRWACLERTWTRCAPSPYFISCISPNWLFLSCIFFLFFKIFIFKIFCFFFSQSIVDVQYFMLQVT